MLFFVNLKFRCMLINKPLSSVKKNSSQINHTFAVLCWLSISKTKSIPLTKPHILSKAQNATLYEHDHQTQTCVLPLVVMMCLFLFFSCKSIIILYQKQDFRVWFFFGVLWIYPVIFWRHCEQELLSRSDCISGIILVCRQMFSGALWGMRACYCWLRARFNSLEKNATIVIFPSMTLYF